MMRSLRNFLYFVVGLFLGCISVLSHAETIPATNSGTGVFYRCWNGVAQTYTPWNETFQGSCAAGGGTWSTQYNKCLLQGTYGACEGQNITNWTCPTGQNWTLSGQNCVRPDCVAPQTRNPANGICEATKCTGTTPGPQMMFDIGTSPTGNPGAVRCLGGCMASFEGSTPAATSVQNGVRRYYAKGRYVPLGNGWSDVCTPSPTSPDSAQGATPQTPADSCPAGHGMIKIDGKVNCVNTSTGASTAEPPQTDNKTTTRTQTTNPDNTTTVTTTTKNNITGGTTTVTETYPPGVAPGTGQPSGSSIVSTGGGAGGIGSATGSGNGDGDKDACEDDPERVGCKHLDEILGEPVDGPDISTGTETLTFTPVAGFGSGSYSCPSNPTMTISILGKSITVFDYAPVCQFASGVRPVVLAFAALAAALIGLGVGRRD